jgi:hypothetical protein
MNPYNATCLITGKTDNLQLHAIRNKDGNMIGWVFLHESVIMKDIDATIDWKFKVEIKENSPSIGDKRK